MKIRARLATDKETWCSRYLKVKGFDAPGYRVDAIYVLECELVENNTPPIWEVVEIEP